MAYTITATDSNYAITATGDDKYVITESSSPKTADTTWLTADNTTHTADETV